MYFLRRLGWYLLGLSIGLVFLVFFLKKKSDGTGTEFCYLPNCRVLKDLRTKPLLYDKGVLVQMNQFQLDSLAIKNFFWEGVVDFSQSDTKSTSCKTYVIKNGFDNKKWSLKVKNCKSNTIIEQIDLVQ